MRYLRSLWIWTASAALVVVWTPIVGLVHLFEREPKRRTARWFRRLGRAVSRVKPWRLLISGRENMDADQVYVIVSNHQSLADIPLLSHLRLDTKWLAKEELFRVPLLGWMLRMAGDIPVNRKVPREGAKAMLRGAKYLKQRFSVVFFPEGSRSPDGEVQAFNEGAFQLAIREQVPILPLVVEGTGAALPSQTWLWENTRDLRLRVLQPVSVEGLTAKDTTALCHRVRQQIMDELRFIRADVPEEAAA